jgi:hypothetical protein
MGERCNSSAPAQMQEGPACFSSLKQVNDFTGNVGDNYWNYSCVNTVVNKGYTKNGEWINVPSDSEDKSDGKQTFGSTIYSSTAVPNAFTQMGSQNPAGGKKVYWLVQGTSLVAYKDSGDGKGGVPIYSTCSPAGSGAASYFVTDTGDIIGKDNNTNDILFARGCTVGAVGAIPGDPCSAKWNIKEPNTTVKGSKGKPSLCSPSDDYNITITQDGVIKLWNVTQNTAVWWNAGGFL